MKNHAAAPLFQRFGMLAPCLALLVAVLPGTAPAASSFVEGLTDFESIDSAVDADGVTYVMGVRSGTSVVLRRYLPSGAPQSWSTTNVVHERTLAFGARPTALFVAPGTNGLFVVGGDRISRLDKPTGHVLASRFGGTGILLRDVYYQSNAVYVCGQHQPGAANFSTFSLFGMTATGRGSQTAFIARLKGSLSTTDPTAPPELVSTFGYSGGNTANSLVVDDSGDVYVAGHLGTGGSFGANFGLSGQWAVRTYKASQAVDNLGKAADVISGAIPSVQSLTFHDYVSFGNGGFPNGAGDNFVIRATGLMQVPAPGATYNFRNVTDDGSWLKVDNQFVIYDNSRHPAQSISGSVYLSPGLHSVEFVMFENGGDEFAQLWADRTGDAVPDLLLQPAGAAGGDRGYLFKLSSTLDDIKNLYYTTSTGTASGGELLELRYQLGWIYAVGFWKGTANNPELGLPDASRDQSEDIEVLKLDTDLVLKGRATVKGHANNRGYSVSSDEAGNVYLTGTFGPGSADFVGEGDRDSSDAARDRSFTSLSASRSCLFVAQLNRDMNFQWVRAPRVIPQIFSSTPTVRWNQQNQRLFWSGHFTDGPLTMGEPETERTLDATKGFFAALDPDGKFTQRVKLTVLSAYGVGGTQVLPFGGPEDANGPTELNSQDLIKGSDLTVSVPPAIYRDINTNDIPVSRVPTDADNVRIDREAETRIVNTGYSVDGNVPTGGASSYRFTLDRDTTVAFNWTMEHALTVDSDFDGTAGTGGILTNSLTSKAAGSPVPAVQKHWFGVNENVIATMDSEMLDLSNPGQAVKYLVTGYRAFGPPNPVSAQTTNFQTVSGPEVRRQVGPFTMTGPAKVTWVWELRVGITVDTTGARSATLPRIRVLKDYPGQVGPPLQTDSVGVGTFFYKERTRLQIVSERVNGMQQLKGWFNGDGYVFVASGTLADLATFTFGGKTYAGLEVLDLVRPARVMWDYGDRVFNEIITIGNSATFTNVDDLTIRQIFRSNQPPVRVDVTEGPQGSTADDMGIWDDTGKRYYPLRPGKVLAHWPTTSADTNERVIIRITINYPTSPHYRHIANTPPVRLDPATNDLVNFKALKYFEAATGAAVDDQQRFTANGPGRSVLLFGEMSAPGRGGVLETLRVRVVQTRLWNDQLPSAVRAPIGQKITSVFDTAGLDSGYVFFNKARYNPFVYDREAISGPIIPVNLHPTAPESEQLVVVWYERRDTVLWPYQPARYQPDWPTRAEGLNRIVIASRYGSESVADDGTDQIVTPEQVNGTNIIPAEVSFNPTRFQQVQIYNQPVSTNAGFNPNEEHALLAPSLRYAAVSPRPMAAYALRDSDLNLTNRIPTYTSDPYVLVQFFDAVDGEFKMKVYNILRAATNLNVGELSYQYSFRQEMEAGEPVIPFYPLPFVIGATPCDGTYGKEGDPNRTTFWKDHKGTGWAVSGNGRFSMYFMYPLLVEFWWPTNYSDLLKNPGDCVPFLPNVPSTVTDRKVILASYLGTNFFKDVNYTRNDQSPPAQQIVYTTIWPENLPVLKVGETLTYSGGEYRADNPITFVPTADGDVVAQDRPGLPAVVGFAAAEVVYDDLNPVLRENLLSSRYTARVLQGLEQRTVNLPVDQLPGVLAPANRRTEVKGGKYVFVELPSSLQRRIFYDPLAGKLGVIGLLNDKDIGEPTLTASPGAVYVLEPNILTARERDILNGTAADSPYRDLAGTTWATKVNELYNLSRNPEQLNRDATPGADTAYYVGLEQKVVTDTQKRPVKTTNSFGIVSVVRDATKAAPLQALGPGLAVVANPNFLDPLDTTLPEVSYVTIAENNHTSLGGAPVSLHILKVDRSQRYRGAIKTILSDNVFDENIILRHTGDFGANPEDLVFEWWYRPEDGTEACTPDGQCFRGGVDCPPNPWKLFADPSGQQGLAFYQLTLKGNPSAPEVLLADTLFFLRYRHRNEPPPTPERITWRNIPFEWAGAGNSTPRDGDDDGCPDYRAQLAEGWVKRVLGAINPYEARIRDFDGDNPATYVNILRQLGARFEGPVALNPAKNVIENVGLIELYETIFKRARDLSIDLSTPISTPGIANALQLASTRLADFYMLLGNEAYSDAVNPTIGYGSDSVEYGHLAPAVFCFQNQLSSLLEEELALLRGQDDNKARPVYNRLFWNFTHAEGEAAYALNYHVTDLNNDGFIDERDAQILYPQGHGDAWGHYLNALRYTYELITHPYFNWVSRSEYLNLQDIVIAVDYLDERKFAQVAAAKAKAGTEIVNMTYREKYVADPDGQWQGYADTDARRAWGFDEWAHRAGQGAYFDWVTANALLPAQHPNTNLTGLAKIDRSTVQDIAVISANLVAVQTKLDEANSGNNPLGVANGAMTFDVDPTFLEVGSTAQIGTRAVQGLFHFDQMFERSLQALKNAKAAFDHANEVQQRLRQVANTEEEFRHDVFQQDLAYRNQLIEIFGTPYAGTIGSGKPYPPGYQGPDTMLYMYVDVREITDATVPRQTAAYRSNYVHELSGTDALFINGTTYVDEVDNTFLARHAESFQRPAASSSYTSYQSVNYTDFSDPSNPPRVPLENMNIPVRAEGYTFQAPTDWGQRASPGELQGIISQMIQAEADVASAIADWDGLQGQIVRILRLLNARYQFSDDVRSELEAQISSERTERAIELTLKSAGGILQAITETTENLDGAAVEAIPRNLPTAGLSFSPGDLLSAARGAIKFIGLVIGASGRFTKVALEAAAGGVEITREMDALRTALNNEKSAQDFSVKEHLTELENTVGDEARKRIEIFKQLQVLRELGDQYRAKLAEGVRLIEERTAFNRRAAAMVQRNRYQDMAFRISRNAALEKYRSAFDLAARYCYVAANAYDYETNLDPNDAGSPVSIINDLIRQRTIGILNEDGQPAVGGGGLSESMAVLMANYNLLKTRMGFNNPQIEVATFSLRHENFRIPVDTNEANVAAWQTALDDPRIYKADLWQVPEFRQYCRPFSASTNGPQPGLVIPFSTTIMSGSNFFGWPLGGGDSAYDPSVYSTKIQSVGLFFEGYPGDELSATPRVYLVPAGTDVIRIPSSDNLDVRYWNVKEQSIPVPMPSIAGHLNDPQWKPLTDSLPTPFGAIRRFSSFRASGFSSDDLEAMSASGGSPEDALTLDTRLIARSVWNTRWLLIIPGATLNADPVHGLKSFIRGPLVNPVADSATGARDGNGVTDIKLVIRTYGFSGN